MAGLLATGKAALPEVGAAKKDKKKAALRVAHITDVHIADGNNAPERFTKYLQEIKNQQIDFFLNGGDSIMDASYAVSYTHLTLPTILLV